jgi:hypothetical protein
VLELVHDRGAQQEAPAGARHVPLVGRARVEQLHLVAAREARLRAREQVARRDEAEDAERVVVDLPREEHGDLAVAVQLRIHRQRVAEVALEQGRDHVVDLAPTCR